MSPEDRAAFVHVGRLYLDALDDDPENEHLTLPAAIAVTAVREAVERAQAVLARPPVGCCVHCHEPIQWSPPAVMGATEPTWVHRTDRFEDGRGSRTCSERALLAVVDNLDRFTGDGWPVATPYEPGPEEVYRPPSDVCYRCGDPAEGWHRYPLSGRRRTPRSSWFRGRACASHRTMDDYAEERAERLAEIVEPEAATALGTIAVTGPEGHDTAVVWVRMADGFRRANRPDEEAITYGDLVLDYCLPWSEEPMLLSPGPPR